MHDIFVKNTHVYDNKLKKLLLTLVACVGLVGWSVIASAAPTRCDVMAHAKQWIDAGIYYSQGPYGGYCSGPMYTDPWNGGTYRPDCSGFVSAVWDRPAPGNTTYSFAGGPWNDGSSYVINFDDLLPGDALNFGGNPSTGTGHIRLFGGWLDDDHNYLWGYETSTCGTTAHYWEHARWDFGGYTAIRLNGIRDCSGLGGAPEPEADKLKLPAQLTGNHAMTVTNWEGEQHAEIWVRGTDGSLYNAWTFENDEWSGLNKLGEDAACGLSAAYWGWEVPYAEVFTPSTDGGSKHAWFNPIETQWEGPYNYGDANISKFSVLRWPDNRIEVFALASSGDIHHKFWLLDDGAWSDWYNLGRDSAPPFASAVSPIVWGDGRPELFVTGTDGKVYNKYWIQSEWTWSEWENLLVGGNIESRPIPVRWDDGRLEVFAVDKDGFLNHAWYYKGEWNPMRKLANTRIQGEVSAVFNPKGNGGPHGPQIFARDMQNKLVELHMDNNAWIEDFRPLLQDRTLGSDPLGWIRTDKKGLLFAVDDQGNLMHSHRGPDGWVAWSNIQGAAIDRCRVEDFVPTVSDDEEEPPDENGSATTPGNHVEPDEEHNSNGDNGNGDNGNGDNGNGDNGNGDNGNGDNGNGDNGNGDNGNGDNGNGDNGNTGNTGNTDTQDPEDEDPDNQLVELNWTGSSDNNHDVNGVGQSGSAASGCNAADRGMTSSSMWLSIMALFLWMTLSRRREASRYWIKP